METSTLPAGLAVGETESYLRADPRVVDRQLKPEALVERPFWHVRRFVGSVVAPPADKMEERQTMLLSLDLHKLATAERKAVIIESAETFFPELKGEELKMWNKFLPTSYDLRDYQYDSIPAEAVDCIAIAKRLGCFDRIIICTPEGNDIGGRTKRLVDIVRERIAEWSEDFAPLVRVRALVRSLDPLAVGIITDYNGNDRAFQIVRWGESLIPVEEVKAHVAKVDRQVQNAIAFSVLGFAGIIAGIVRTVRR